MQTISMVDSGNKKKWTGVFLSSNIIFDRELSWSARVIYADIACYSKGCFVSNSKIAKRYNMKPNSVSQVIQVLLRKGWIYAKRSENGKHRRLYARKYPLEKTRGGVLDTVAPYHNFEKYTLEKSDTTSQKKHTIDNSVDNSKDNSLTNTSCFLEYSETQKQILFIFEEVVTNPEVILEYENEVTIFEELVSEYGNQEIERLSTYLLQYNQRYGHTEEQQIYTPSTFQQNYSDLKQFSLYEENEQDFASREQNSAFDGGVILEE